MPRKPQTKNKGVKLRKGQLMRTKRKGKISRNVGMNLRGTNEVNLGDKRRFYRYNNNPIYVTIWTATQVSMFAKNSLYTLQKQNC